MNRIVASAGLAALGAASMQAAYTPGLTPMEQSKPWAVTVGVRGFYDDNYATQTEDLERDSYGVSINPTVAVNTTLGTTLVQVKYSYDMRWYEDRTSNEADHIHNAFVRVNHAFSERTSIDVTDRFTYGQEGNVEFGPITSPTVLQNDADHIRNMARIAGEFAVSSRVALEVSYQNDIVDYEQEGVNSRSSLLDSTTHLPGAEAKIGLANSAEVLIGYKYSVVDHRDGAFFTAVPGGPLIESTARDARSHIIYGGLEHDFNPQWNGSIRAGVQITDYPNSELYPAGSEIDDNTVDPYVDLRLTWSYNPGSFLQIGVVNSKAQTDISALDQDALAVFLALNHRITPRLTFGANGLFQHSKFNGGTFDGETELLYQAGVSLDYMFGPNLSAEVGYSYDKLDSDIPRDYDRNRIYLGMRAAF